MFQNPQMWVRGGERYSALLNASFMIPPMTITNPPNSLQTLLFSTPLSDLQSVYDKLDKHGKDIKAIRTLCQLDLFYLLVRVCKRRRHDAAVGLRAS